jgi:hypothetical protein
MSSATHRLHPVKRDHPRREVAGPPSLLVSSLLSRIPLPDLTLGRRGTCSGARSNAKPLMTHQVLATAPILLSAIVRGAVSCAVPSPGHMAWNATSPPVS